MSVESLSRLPKLMRQLNQRHPQKQSETAKPGNQSGRGQPHSKTLSRWIARRCSREVLECGCPLPLSFWVHVCTGPFLGLMLLFVGNSFMLTSAVTTARQFGSILHDKFRYIVRGHS